MPRIEEHYKFPCGYEYKASAKGWTTMGGLKFNVEILCPMHGAKCHKTK